MSLPVAGGSGMDNLLRDGPMSSKPLVGAKLPTYAKPPDTLYHYTRQAGLLGIVRDGLMWASQVQFLNDSEEFVHAWRMLDRWLPDDGLGDAFRAVLSRDRQLKHRVCVTSFSELGDDLSQWRAYGDVGNAYSIGFDVAVLIKLADEYDGQLVQCLYDDAAQLQLIANRVGSHYEMFQRFYEKVGGNLRANIVDVNEIVDRFMAEFVYLAPLLKSDAFSAEREYRLIFAPPYKGLGLQFRQSKHFIVPHLELRWDGLGFKYPISELVVGPGEHTDLAAEAVRTLLFQRGWFMDQVRVTKVPYRG